MKKPITKTIKEVDEWFSNHGYGDEFAVVVDAVFVNVSKEIPDDVIAQFNQDFSTNLEFVTSDSTKENNLVYICFIKQIEDYRKRMGEWLEANNMECHFVVESNAISLSLPHALDEGQIKAFEREFDLSLQSHKLEYEDEFIYRFMIL